MAYYIIGTFIIGFLCGLACSNWIKEWREDRKFFKWFDQQDAERREFFGEGEK